MDFADFPFFFFLGSGHRSQLVPNHSHHGRERAVGNEAVCRGFHLPSRLHHLVGLLPNDEVRVRIIHAVPVLRPSLFRARHDSLRHEHR